MAKQLHPTPMLDQLESGPWPSFVTGLKRLAKDKDYVVDLLGHLEHSYETRKGYWKGGTVGVFGGHTSFGDARRNWDFRSVGRGMIDFESIIVALNDIGYQGPLSVEWEDSRMDRVHGATESAAFCKRLDFKPAAGAFDAVFARDKQA